MLTVSPATPDDVRQYTSTMGMRYGQVLMKIFRTSPMPRTSLSAACCRNNSCYGICDLPSPQMGSARALLSWITGRPLIKNATRLNHVMRQNRSGSALKFTHLHPVAAAAITTFQLIRSSFRLKQFHSAEGVYQIGEVYALS